MVSPTSSNRKKSLITQPALNFSAQPKTIDYATVKPSTDQAETDHEFKVPFQIDSMERLKYTNRTAGGCKLPPGGYKSWNRGVVLC